MRFPRLLWLWLGLIFVLAAADHPAIAFRNVTALSGVNFVLRNSPTPERRLMETMIGGVALLDFNNDGLLDLYFTNGAELPSLRKNDKAYWNRLYRNDGNLRFTDVTAQAGVAGTGYGMGVAAGDFDGDGFTDLYVTGIGQNQLFRNLGDGTFADVTAAAGDLARILPPHAFPVTAGWFDYDNNGKLDLFIVQYVKRDAAKEPACTVRNIATYCSPVMFEFTSNFLLRNDGKGSFTDVSKEAGIAAHQGKGMGVAFADYDSDGFQDVFVANDTFRNFLFHNRGDGTFEELAVTAGVAYNEHGEAIAGMGADFRDINGDGRPDIFLTGMFGNTFPLFTGARKGFTDTTSASGIAKATTRFTGWGAGAFDFDNDGRKDLFTANGAILDNSDQVDGLPYRQPNLVLRQDAGGRFLASTAGEPAPHRGAAFGDLDNDGLIDVVTTVIQGPPEILRNQSAAGNHWLTVALRSHTPNRLALGARVTIESSAGIQHNQAGTAGSYSSSNDPRVHFGLGSASRVSKLTIKWPGGREQVLTNLTVDRILVIEEPRP